jgi:hypothetical protein
MLWSCTKASLRTNPASSRRSTTSRPRRRSWSSRRFPRRRGVVHRAAPTPSWRSGSGSRTWRCFSTSSAEVRRAADDMWWGRSRRPPAWPARCSPSSTRGRRKHLGHCRRPGGEVAGTSACRARRPRPSSSWRCSSVVACSLLRLMSRGLDRQRLQQAFTRRTHPSKTWSRPCGAVRLPKPSSSRPARWSRSARPRSPPGPMSSLSMRRSRRRCLPR